MPNRRSPYHQSSRSRQGSRTAGMGHEKRFPSPGLSGRCRLREATFAGMGGKEEDAPFPVTRHTLVEGVKSTQTRPSRPRQWVIGSARKRPFASGLPLRGNRRLSQFGEEGAGGSQIGGVEAFGKPAEDRSEQGHRLLGPALLAAQAGEAHRAAQFPG